MWLLPKECSKFFARITLKTISILEFNAERFSFRTYNLKPIYHVGTFVLYLVYGRKWWTNFYRSSYTFHKYL